jgi:23S rRNA (cytidine1920-2'-O)/16S rRNA (cytidine1409-2'-O)-methyltransferase
MKSKPGKKRLDVLLVERGLAESLEKARAMILAGEVRVDGARADKAGTSISEKAGVEIASWKERWRIFRSIPADGFASM